MSKEIFKSDRYFTVFDYLVSHGQLLIRSDKRKGSKENIDIIFFDTSFMQLFTTLSGITIRLVNSNSITTYTAVKKYLSYEENNLFEIESEGEKYYIAASFVKIFENELEFNETSLGYESKGRQNEIAGSL
ncbi:hypothetical protein GVN16_10460 [Emticicia sp. CRIBPO]|uniref:hypothetical protein n=1 Tax=Emticicia sp. CRIBPO TaxID=2683258 RepID=UPI0014131FC5|nr:hypothetical protein [Emticicia sp. CRIBPO]NBA86185.1 hypothetical protein [Emticicia sp. CRIBPO]